VQSREAKIAIFGQTATNLGKERLCVPKGSNLPQNLPPKSKIISAKKQPKMSQSFMKVAQLALQGKNCGIVRKRESCAKVALRNIAIFWAD